MESLGQSDQYKKEFTRRALILGGLQGVLLTSLVGRMYQLEILSKDHYQMLSDKNRIHARLMAPLRGQILDRKGRVLASNTRSYRAVIVREQGWREKLDAVIHLLNLSDVEQQRIAVEAERRAKYIILKDNLSWSEVSQLELHIVPLGSVFIELGYKRDYPYPVDLSHILGYVGAPSLDAAVSDPLLQLPGFRIGKAGIEKQQEDRLRGKAGLQHVEVNAVRQVVRELSVTPSVSGEDLTLSIDLEMQQYAMSRLSPYHSAVGILMDIHTGFLMTLASTPGYNTTLFVDGISSKNWRELSTNPYQALLNKAVSGQYSPGSTFKMVVALAALKAGVINRHASVFCPGHVMLGNHAFHCHKKGGHGSVSLETALSKSCDVYFFHVAGLMGIDPIAQMAAQFGLGQLTGIDLPGEKPGLIPSRSWKSLVMGRNWHLGETYNASIGQGYVLATPLQLAVMTAQLANGGRRVRPSLTVPLDLHPSETLDLDPQHLAWVLSGMVKAMNEPGGTGYSARVTKPGYEIAGKTGTTQVRGISAQERKAGLTSGSNRAWHHRDHALFVGYAPIHAPRYATVVLIEHEGSGGKIAAPIGRDLLLMAQGAPVPPLTLA